MKKKLITIPLAILAAIVAVGWLAAPSVQAHNALATPSCTGLAWSATNYERTQTNSITVIVDGVVVHQDTDFKASDVGSSPWSQTQVHSWSVVVDAPSTQFDRSFAGTWQACVAPTTTVPETTVPATTVAPTTTVPAPTTTMAEATTTTVVEVCDTLPGVATCNPPAPTTPATTLADISVLVPAAEPILPRTGNGAAFGLWIGGFLVGAGIVGMAFTRRRRT